MTGTRDQGRRRDRMTASAPSRDQIQHRLLQSLVDHGAERAAKRKAAGEGEDTRISAAQRIRAIRERLAARRNAEGELAQGQDLRRDDRESDRLEHVAVHFFHTSVGDRVIGHWVKGATDAATILERTALQVVYASVPRERKPETRPHAQRLSALTAAVSCPWTPMEPAATPLP
jgi:hypothetical protein